MNPAEQGSQQGSEPPLRIPPVRQGYGKRPAHRSPPPPVRKRAAAYMAPARAPCRPPRACARAAAASGARGVFHSPGGPAGCAAGAPSPAASPALLDS